MLGENLPKIEYIDSGANVRPIKLEYGEQLPGDYREVLKHIDKHIESLRLPEAPIEGLESLNGYEGILKYKEARYWASEGPRHVLTYVMYNIYPFFLSELSLKDVLFLIDKGSTSLEFKVIVGPAFVSNVRIYVPLDKLFREKYGLPYTIEAVIEDTKFMNVIRIFEEICRVLPAKLEVRRLHTIEDSNSRFVSRDPLASTKVELRGGEFDVSKK